MSRVDRVTSRGHAFLSYVREDSEDVDKLQDALEAAGIAVWRDTANLSPGQEWKLEIERAIATGCHAFVACFSSNGAAREISDQREELLLAVEQIRRRQPGRPWFIPVRFSDCTLPVLSVGAGRDLSSFQRIDLFGADREAATARLIAAVRAAMDEPTRAADGSRDTVDARTAPESSGRRQESAAAASADAAEFVIRAPSAAPARSPQLNLDPTQRLRADVVVASDKSRDLLSETADYEPGPGEPPREVANPGFGIATGAMLKYSPNPADVEAIRKQAPEARGVPLVRRKVFYVAIFMAVLLPFCGAAFSFLGSKLSKEENHVQTTAGEIHGLSAPATAVAFSANGRLLAVGVGDKYGRFADFGFGGASLWVVADEGALSPAYAFDRIVDGVYDVEFSPNGKLLAIAGKTIQIWDVQSPQASVLLTEIKRGSTTIAFSPNGSMLAAAGDGPPALWDVSNPAEPLAIGSIFDRADFNVHSVAFSSDGKYLANTNWYGANVWDIRVAQSPTLVAAVKDTGDFPAEKVFFDRDTRSVILLAWDVVDVFDISSSTTIDHPASVTISNGQYGSGALDSIRNRIVVADEDQIAVFQAEAIGTTEPTASIAHGSVGIRDIAVDKTGRFLAVASIDGVKVWIIG